MRKGVTMKRLDFICEEWHPDENTLLRSATRLLLKDYSGAEQDCWHLRGRGWKWITLRHIYPKLTAGVEYELSFWGKIDYYDKSTGAQCYIDLFEISRWEQHKSYEITPNCANAELISGDWVLYKFRFTPECDSDFVAQIISFESNIALMQASSEDETAKEVLPVVQSGNKLPFYINQELPFREYSSLEQRIVKYYQDLLAPYYPCKDISGESQKEYYSFIQELYDKLFTEPEGFFSRLYEDDAHPNRFNNASYKKPELKRHMKGDQAKIEELFLLLIDIGKTGGKKDGQLGISSDMTKKQERLLAYMGFTVAEGFVHHNKYKDIGEAIIYLAGKEKNLWSMMYCWFEVTYPYLEKTYAKHYNHEQYERLTGWLQEHGYQSSVGSCSGVTLDYYKCSAKEEKLLGYAIHGDKFHYGFTFEFRADARVMQHCELRIIRFADILNTYDTLSDQTRTLVKQRTKRCDFCRYCIQTDKTGKRPLAAIIMEDGTGFCPYYPGFNYVFEQLNELEVDWIIAFLIDMEKVILVEEKPAVS